MPSPYLGMIFSLSVILANDFAAGLPPCRYATQTIMRQKPMKLCRVVVRTLLAAFACATLGLMPAAHASPVTWNLTGATFDDGTTATGSFVYDATTNTVSNWHVSTQTSPVLSAFTYDDTTSVSDYTAANHVAFRRSDRYITMLFTGNMTDAGGSIDIALTPGGGNILNGSYECSNCGSVRRFTDGAITASPAQAVPEPGTLALVVGVLPLVALVRRRRS